MNEDRGGKGGDVDGSDGDRGDKVRGKDVRDTPGSLIGEPVPRDVGPRRVLPSPPEGVRAKGFRTVLGGGITTDGRRFVGEDIRLASANAGGAGEVRELVLEPGLAGLVEREAAERRDVVRPSPALPVRVCPTAGRTVTGGGRYDDVSALHIYIVCNIHYLTAQVGWWNASQ